MAPTATTPQRLVPARLALRTAWHPVGRLGPVAYQSLYRRYRPRRFAEVRGQEHVVKALRNAVRDDRVGHAYLFSGPRGTGKTTSARILAKVLNCTNPVDGEPCCVCDSCKAVEAGTSYDVHELDAASNNGVDSMRDLIEKASLGTPGRHKVYILDEVHMLSKAAEAALLKTLEEPPPHVVFVLATTDPQKVSETIRSRSQQLHFRLLPAETLEAHVRWLAADAGLTVDDAAVEAVVRLGGGSARDTISALEQVVAAGGVAPDAEPLDDLLEALIDTDPGRALAGAAAAVNAGRDARVLTEALLAQLRDGFLSIMAPDLVRLPDKAAARVADQGHRLGAAATVRAMEVLGEILVEMRHAPDPRVLLDVALVRLTSPTADTSAASLLARIERLERAVAGDGPLPAAAPRPSGDGPPAAGPARATGAEAAAASGLAARAAAAGARSAGAAGLPSSTAAGTVPAATAAAASTDPPTIGRPPTSAAAPASPTSAAPGSPTSAEPSALLATGLDRPAVEDAPHATPSATPRPRAQLGARAKGPATAPSRPAATASAAPPSGVAPSPPATSADDATSSSSTTVPGERAVGAPNRDQLTLAWPDHILPKLKGMTKARYAAGRFLPGGDSGAAVLAFPNAPHRDACEALKGEVEQVLAAHFGQPVSLTLVVDGPTGADPRQGTDPAGGDSGRDRDGAAGRLSVPDPGPPEEDIDLNDLVDAPADTGPTAIERVAQAFPGAKLLDDVAGGA